MEKPLRVFCCYAHEDLAYLLMLKRHLKPLQQQNLIALWHDRDISAGEKWAFEINEHLHTSQIILLLISSAFMDSEYCYSIEMKQAMERHERGEARVIPIILRPVLWEGAPFGKLQALPTEAEPVSSKFWYTEDHAFFDVARGIQEMVKKLITQRQNEVPSVEQTHTTQKVRVNTHAVTQNTEGETTRLLEPFTKVPQCTWVIAWPESHGVADIVLKYDDELEGNPGNYKHTMPDDVQQAVADWYKKSENDAKLNALRTRLEGQPEALHVRLKRAEWRHYSDGAATPLLKYIVWLSPIRYLYYNAIHECLGKDIELRHLRARYLRNVFIDFEQGATLVFPSDFALHIAVVSRDGYLLLRQRTSYTEHFPLAWEAGVGEFMHGPGPLDMPDVEVAADPGRLEFRHFDKHRTPSLFLFLKNAIAEELGYQRARERDFHLYGFAVEHETLAPKLLALYNSDCTIDTLLRSARDARKTKDLARNLSTLELTPRAIAEAHSNSRYLSWEPKSKLLMLLALKQDLEAKGLKDQSSEVEKLTDCFRPGDTLVDPWEFHE